MRNKAKKIALAMIEIVAYSSLYYFLWLLLSVSLYVALELEEFTTLEGWLLSILSFVITSKIMSVFKAKVTCYCSKK